MRLAALPLFAIALAFSAPGIRPTSAQVVVTQAASQDQINAAPVGQAQRQAPPKTAAYPLLTHHRSSVANFNEEVFRGVVQSLDGAHIYALNSSASTILHFEGTDTQVSQVWPTLHQPVALALYNGDLLVVGGASRALVLHSGSTGEILDAVTLGAEPADIAVDQDRERAYIACQGDDSVREIDLLNFEELRRFQLTVKRPGFLHLDTQGAEPILYVTPMISGNNTMAVLSPEGTSLLRGNDPEQFPSGGLPDVDLLGIHLADGVEEPTFALLRNAGSVLLAHGIHPETGDHWLLGIDEINANPELATEPLLQGRFARNVVAIAPSLEGFLASSSSAQTVSATQVLKDPTLVPEIPRPAVIIDLDDSDPFTEGGQYDRELRAPLAFPYGLSFSSTGLALVSAAGSDRIGLLDSSGARLFDFNLPAGSIPRQVLLSPSEQSFLVYCQGNQSLQAFSLNPPVADPVLVRSLGSDPTPEFLRTGRQLWYDSDHSAEGRFSCNTCHVAGGADGLAWNLSSPPQDVKGVMLTQSLFGIDDTFPYHWRGERDLRAFNGAFVGLLGADSTLDETPGGELDAFNAFVASLQQNANPNQSLHRELTDWLASNSNPKSKVAPNGLVGSAIDGLNHYFNSTGPQGNACVDCHALPTGSLADYRPQPIFSTQISSEATIEIANFEQFDLRDQPLVQVNTQNGSIQRPLLGFGMGHSGGLTSLFDFLDGFNVLDDQQAADVLALIRQWDLGMAPAAHVAWLLNSDSPASLETRIRSVLLEQAQREWIDVAAFGQLQNGQKQFQVGLLYNPLNERFESDDPQLGSFQTQELFDLAEQGAASLLFVGLPLGNGTRFGLDRDLDGLSRGEELALGTDPYTADTDGDGDSDGLEMAHNGDPLDSSVGAEDNTAPQLTEAPVFSFANARSAKLLLRANEPVRVEALVQTAGGEALLQTLWHFDSEHTLVLRGLDPSPSDASVGNADRPGNGTSTNPVTGLGNGLGNVYSGKLLLTDRAGNRTEVALDNFTSQSGFPSNPQQPHTRIGNIQALEITPAQESLQVTLAIDVVLEDAAPNSLPARDQVIVAQVLRRIPGNKLQGSGSELQISTQTNSDLARSFQLSGETYDALPGPFLVSAPTGIDGRAIMSFSEPAVALDEELIFNILSVIQVSEADHDALAPNFTQDKPMAQYQFPATPPNLRQFEIVNNATGAQISD